MLLRFILAALFSFVFVTANAQIVAPAPSTIQAGVGTPMANNISCNLGAASSNTASLYVQTEALSGGGGIWKCVYQTSGNTYGWIAPVAPPAQAFNLAGTALGTLRCAYGLVTTSTSGTASVSYSAMNFTTLSFITVQSVATGNTAATVNNASVSSVTTTGANIAVTTPTTISLLGALTVQLASAATPVYVQACGI